MEQKLNELLNKANEIYKQMNSNEDLDENTKDLLTQYINRLDILRIQQKLNMKDEQFEKDLQFIESEIKFFTWNLQDYPKYKNDYKIGIFEIEVTLNDKNLYFQTTSSQNENLQTTILPKERNFHKNQLFHITSKIIDRKVQNFIRSVETKQFIGIDDGKLCFISSDENDQRNQFSFVRMYINENEQEIFHLKPFNYKNDHGEYLNWDDEKQMFFFKEGSSSPTICLVRLLEVNKDYSIPLKKEIFEWIENERKLDKN